MEAGALKIEVSSPDGRKTNECNENKGIEKYMYPWLDLSDGLVANLFFQNIGLGTDVIRKNQVRNFKNNAKKQER